MAKKTCWVQAGAAIADTSTSAIGATATGSPSSLTSEYP